MGFLLIFNKKSVLSTTPSHFYGHYRNIFRWSTVFFVLHHNLLSKATATLSRIVLLLSVLIVVNMSVLGLKRKFAQKFPRLANLVPDATLTTIVGNDIIHIQSSYLKTRSWSWSCPAILWQKWYFDNPWEFLWIFVHDCHASSHHLRKVNLWFDLFLTF